MFMIHPSSKMAIGITLTAPMWLMAPPVRAGIQIRKSKDLVEWQFVGWVFSDIPPLGANYIKSQGGKPNDGLWAPEIVKQGNEYRLYYSLASNLIESKLYWSGYCFFAHRSLDRERTCNCFNRWIRWYKCH